VAKISYLLHVVLKGVQFAYDPILGGTTSENIENILIQTEIRKNGLEIIPNELWIRRYTQTDIERFSKHLEDAGYKPPIPTEKQLVIEYSYSDTTGWRFASPGDIVILALKLVRKGRVVEDIRYTIEKETGKIILLPLYIFGVSPYYVPTSFYLYPSDANKIRELFQNLMNYEWKRTDPLRIALLYFSRACNELNPEDKIIESCKGYEALFTEGKKVKGAIRKHIATKCSNYLSEFYDARAQWVRPSRRCGTGGGPCLSWLPPVFWETRRPHPPWPPQGRPLLQTRWVRKGSSLPPTPPRRR